MKRITSKQLEIMQVLWRSDQSLTASEIASSDPALNINTVQVCIRQLLKNEYIRVADIVYSGTVLCRSYSPIVSKQEYVDTFFRDDIGGLSAALSIIDETNDTSMLDELEKAIERKRKSIKEE
jgi:predicted transcriptional regulator